MRELIVRPALAAQVAWERTGREWPIGAALGAAVGLALVAGPLATAAVGLALAGAWAARDFTNTPQSGETNTKEGH